MIAFTPVPDLQYDRDGLDQYMGNRSLYLRKFNHTGSFFRDYENNIFLGMNVRDLKIDFNIKCRVETLSQQMNLYRKIEMYANVGVTHYDHVSADFHIPKEILINIANHAGFEFDLKSDSNGTTIFKVKDEVSFLSYLNKNSNYFISYKLRAITGNNEYFMRIPNVYVHVNKQDKLNAGSGESQGQTMTNFDIDWDISLIIKVPSFYVFGSCKAVYYDIPLLEDPIHNVGLWTYNVLEVPSTNKNGWEKLFHTTYEYDKEEIEKGIAEIDISCFFQEVKLKTIIESHLQLNMSPDRFLSLSLFNLNDEAICDINWETEILTIKGNRDNRIIIACYIDKEYVNKQSGIIQNAIETRLS